MKQLKGKLCLILCLAMVFTNAGCSKKSEVPSPTGSPLESLPNSGDFPQFRSGKFVRKEILLSNLPEEEAPKDFTLQSVTPVFLFPGSGETSQPVGLFESVYLNKAGDSSQIIYHFYSRTNDGSWSPVSEITPLMKGVFSLADSGVLNSKQYVPLKPAFAGMDEKGGLYFANSPLESLIAVSTDGTVSEIPLDVKSVKSFDVQNQQLSFGAVSGNSIYCVFSNSETQTWTAVFFDKSGNYKTQYDGISSKSSPVLLNGQLITLLAEGNKKVLHYLDIKSGKENDSEDVTDMCVDNIYWNILSGDSEGNLYLANENGVFCKHSDAKSWEQTVESQFTPMPSGFSLFKPISSSLFLISSHSSDGIVYYSYQYDPEATTDTILTIFALSDENGPQFLPTYILTQPVIELAAEKYMDEHPEVSIQINYPAAEGRETASDSIKALNSRLLAGKGEDIIMLDGLPYSSLLEKGALTDLSGLAQDADLFSDALFRPFTKDGMIYAVPARFHVPMLQGSADALRGIGDFHSFVEKAKKLSKENPDITPFVLMNPEALAEVFYPVCAPAWIKDDKTFDSEAYCAFLKEIFELSGLAGKEYLELEKNEGYTWDTQNGIWKDDHNEYVPISFYISDPSNILFFMLAFDYLNYLDPKAGAADRTQTLLLRPGQAENVVMPSRIFSINKNSKNQEAASDFIRFALGSRDIQMSPYLYDGLPSGKTALHDYLKENLSIETTHSTEASGDGQTNLGSFSEKETEALFGLFLTLDNPVVTDQMLYEIAMPQIRKYLNGAQSLEQTVENTQQKVNLYLKE